MIRIIVVPRFLFLFQTVPVYIRASVKLYKNCEKVMNKFIQSFNLLIDSYLNNFFNPFTLLHSFLLLHPSSCTLLLSNCFFDVIIYLNKNDSLEHRQMQKDDVSEGRMSSGRRKQSKAFNL